MVVLSIEEDFGLTPVQLAILAQIHVLAREMEKINNRGKAHYLIAMIQELSAGVVAESYIREKFLGIFGEHL